MLRIPQRIERIASYIPEGARLVDVGTDHALLPIHALTHGSVVHAVASDLREGPLQAAAHHIRQAGLEGRIETRLGSGLTTVTPGEVDTAVVAGMGGAVITDILQSSPAVVARLKRLILQPMGGARRVREYLLQHGLSICHEEVFLQQEKFYVLIVAEPIGITIRRCNGDRETVRATADAAVRAMANAAVRGTATGTDGDTVSDYELFSESTLDREMALEFGPRLLRYPTSVARHYIEMERNRWDTSSRELDKSTRPDAQVRAENLLRKIRWVDEWLKECSGDGKGSPDGCEGGGK